MIVLDASVLIAYLTRDDAHRIVADELIAHALRTNQGLLVNPVTVSEVLVAPTREGRFDAVWAELSNLGVVEVPFPLGAAKILARLRVDTGLKLPDCIVLLTAMDQKCTLATFDDRLRRAAPDLGTPVKPR
jgi:predicted nucleic acid-binding protein